LHILSALLLGFARLAVGRSKRGEDHCTVWLVIFTCRAQVVTYILTRHNLQKPIQAPSFGENRLIQTKRYRFLVLHLLLGESMSLLTSTKLETIPQHPRIGFPRD